MIAVKQIIITNSFLNVMTYISEMVSVMIGLIDVIENLMVVIAVSRQTIVPKNANSANAGMILIHIL